MSKTMNIRMAQVSKTKSEFEQLNPILLKGEIAWESDTSKMKVGDGVTAYVTLPYLIDVVNDLTTGGTNVALSAEQGKVLSEQIGNIGTLLDTINGEVI